MADPNGVATTTTVGTTNVVTMGDATPGSGSVKSWTGLPKASDTRFVYASSDPRIATISVDDATGEVIITANTAIMAIPLSAFMIRSPGWKAVWWSP